MSKNRYKSSPLERMTIRLNDPIVGLIHLGTKEAFCFACGNLSHFIELTTKHLQKRCTHAAMFQLNSLTWQITFTCLLGFGQPSCAIWHFHGRQVISKGLHVRLHGGASFFSSWKPGHRCSILYIKSTFRLCFMWVSQIHTFECCK